jgi:biotin carboxyl carrier protein
MSHEIEKAAQDAVQAAQQSEQYALLLATVQAAQAQQQAPCQHHPVPAPRPSSAGKWVAAGIGGSVFLLAVAVSAVAVAVSAVALTVCLLVLRSVWQDVQREREERRG